MKRCNITAAVGWTILEFAIAIPVLISAGVATYDVARVFQGKTALKAATEATLRCMVTAEGDCLAEAAHNITAPTQYSIQITEETPVISIPLVHYHGKASTSLAPTYQLTKQASKITSINQRATQFLETIETITYPNTMKVNGYIREFVHIAGFSPRTPAFTDSTGRTFNPQFSGNYNVLVQEGEQKSVQIKIPHYPNAAGETGCALFSTMQDKTPSTCGNFPWRAGAAMGNNSEGWIVPNTVNKNELTDITYAVLFIEGTSTGTSREVEGKVLLNLSRTDTSQGLPTSLNLGGQYFKGPSFNANFYPRGAHTSWISGPITETNNGALPYEMAHYQAIAVHPGETISLKFLVQRESAPVRNTSLMWKLGSVKIYLPKYKNITQEVDCKSNSSCDPVCHLSAYGLNDSPLSVLSKTSASGACLTSPLPPRTLAQGNACFLTSYNEDTSSVCPLGASAEKVACGNEVFVQRGVDPLITATNECGILGESPIHSVQTDSVTLDKTFSTKSCSELPLQEPQEWSSLAGDFSYKVIGYTPTTYDPGCSGFTQSEDSFGDCTVDASKNITGLFTIPQRQETEIPYDRLKTEALACGMSPLSDFKASFTVTGNSEIVPSSSTLLGVISSPSVQRTVVDLGSYPVGEFPEICRTKNCIKTEIPTSTSGNAVAEVNESVAMSVAKSTLRTYFPNADISTNCGERGDCFEININSRNEPLSVSIKGRTTAITSNIGIGSFPIKYEQSQYSERYIGD